MTFRIQKMKEEYLDEVGNVQRWRKRHKVKMLGDQLRKMKRGKSCIPLTAEMAKAQNDVRVNWIWVLRQNMKRGEDTSGMEQKYIFTYI